MSLYVYTYCHIHGTLVALGVTQDSFHRTQHLGGGGWGTLHLKGVGVLVGNFELNP